MVGAFLMDDEIIHFITVLASLLVLFVSVLTYRKTRERKHLSLMIGFIFFSAIQFESLYEALLTSGKMISLPLINIHLEHLFLLVTSLSFFAAIYQLE
jgi:hypothetical protein